MFGERAVVRLDEVRLTHGRDRLKLRQVRGSRRETEKADACSDRAAADKHDPPAASTDRVDFLGKQLDPLMIERAVGLREHSRADLHYHRVCGGCDLLAERLGG